MVRSVCSAIGNLMGRKGVEGISLIIISWITLRVDLQMKKMELFSAIVVMSGSISNLPVFRGV